MTQSSTPPTLAAAEPSVPCNGFGITALALALVGLVFGLVPFTGFIALILGMLAVLFGLLGWARTHKGIATNRKMTVIGAALGVGAAALGIWGMTIVFGAVDQLGKDLDKTFGGDPAAMSDVTASDCSVTSEFGTALTYATVKITNSTDRTQSYLVTIGVNDAGGARIGEINVASNSLAAGQSVTLSGANASGAAIEGAKPGPATCVVANVDRFPS
ncbi:MAG: hypothetical protein M3460_07205 [Actinomycetota bacterium]|nr:hypothetical protein [Actinomycetota bacterium]